MFSDVLGEKLRRNKDINSADDRKTIIAALFSPGWRLNQGGPGACFPKVPRTFWARKASSQTAIRLF